jgi:hypothetical protein
MSRSHGDPFWPLILELECGEMYPGVDLASLGSEKYMRQDIQHIHRGERCRDLVRHRRLTALRQKDGHNTVSPGLFQFLSNNPLQAISAVLELGT